ncbi:unnamed protein product [Cylicocyclus nassatus]|uniref:Uncharacterized protein n=1 Tax=Cylicocyclus nassatus TaxID=53992 RepID=A0AA36GUI0_CYLNA|nr:unnamed protein product [Cylicocyclus nassatus]
MDFDPKDDKAAGKLDKAEVKNVSKKEKTGEMLEECTDQEWETGATAMPAEMLNIEKKPSTVNVFVAPKEKGETILQSTSRQVERIKGLKDPIQQLVYRILNLMISERENTQPTVDILIKSRSGQLQVINME